MIKKPIDKQRENKGGRDERARLAYVTAGGNEKDFKKEVKQ